MAIGTSSRTLTSVNSSLPPTSSEVELANAVRRLFYRARAHRRPLVSQWNRNYRLLRNRTWSDERPGWLPSPEVPEVYPIISSVVGWYTDQRPTWDCVPASEPHTPYHEFYSGLSHDLRTVLQAIWLIYQYEAEVEQVVWDGMLYGGGIFKSGWDASLLSGLGDAVMRRVDPYTFYPDPGATSMLDANYFIEARTMSLQEMDRRWPGSADRFTEGGWVEDVDEAPNAMQPSSTFPRANPAAMPGNPTSFGRPGQSRISYQATEDPGVTVFECWLREHEVVDNPEDNSIQGVNDTWRVVVIAGNNVLMDEQAKDLWKHAQHPYDRFVPHRTGEFWGLSMVDYLRPSQLAINRILASLQLNVELTGSPVFKESPRAGISRTKMTSRPGQRLTVNDGGVAEWMQPPQVSPMMMEMVQFYIGEMERISGLTSLSRGNMPAGRNAQGTIDSLQESSFIRVRLGLRNLEWALRATAEKVASLVVENYTVPRMVAFTGDEGQQRSLALRGHHFYLPSDKGREPMRFQLLLSAGSQSATSRMARIQEADTLFAMGAIDIPALLAAHDYPNRDLIWQRISHMMATGAWQPPGARQRTQRSS